ncbi:MAG: hypothetical protein ACLGII_10430, partial [Gammaproteobacteria bacterium]
MSRCTEPVSLASLLLATTLAFGAAPAAAQQGASKTSVPRAPAAAPWQDVGRTATADEIAAWDIDVRADFKGLPPGSGSVLKGQEVWEAKCASCHG